MQNIFKQTDQEKYLLVGEEEILGLYALKYICSLASKGLVNKVMLINPNKDNLSFLVDELEPELLVSNPTIEDLEHFAHSGMIITIGVSLFSGQFDLLKKSKNNSVVFVESLGLFKETVLKQFKQINFVESTFNFFLKSQIMSEKKFDGDLLYEETKVFVNREEEKLRIAAFAKSDNLRAIKIVGMPGIGKRSLLKELRGKNVVDGNWLEFHFQDSTDSLNDVLSFLFSKLGIDYQIDDTVTYSLKDRETVKMVKNLFATFDKLNNTKLIFYNTHLIYHTGKNSFLDPELSDFMKQLINRSSYSGNKIYFISNANFKIDLEVDHLTSVELVQKLEVSHIKQLMEKEFSKLGLYDFSSAVASVPDDIIDKICDGHPYIAKLFVMASETYGLKNLLNDEDLTELFNREHKVKYLISRISIEQKERSLLTLLSFFTEDIDFQFIKKHTNNPTIIEGLINKFLLERTLYKDGNVKYYVPALIKDLLISELNLNDVCDLHNIIGDYYWASTEELSADIIDGYRKSFYHYNAAGNSEKINLLTLRFKDKMITKAYSYINSGVLQKAWELLDELYVKGYLSSPVHIIKYLNTQIKLGKNVKELPEKIDKALLDFSNHPGVLLLKAKFLFNNGALDEARALCEHLSPEFPSQNQDLNTLYVRILYKSTPFEFAASKNKAWIKQVEGLAVSNKRLDRTLANAYQILLNNEISQLLDFKKIIKNALRSMETFDKPYAELYHLLESETEYTDLIIQYYERIPISDLKYLRGFVGYLNRKGRLQQLDNLTEEAKIKLEKLELSIPRLFSLAREKASRTDDLFYYVQNKMSVTEDGKFKDFLGVEDFLKTLETKIDKMLFLFKKADSLKNERSSFYYDYTLALQFRENLTNLAKIVYLSQNNLDREVYLAAQKNNVLFVEGETDELYLKAAAKVLGRNHLNMSIRWIGHLDTRGNVSFSGDTALNHTYNYYQSNPDVLSTKGKIILLYDSDTKKTPFQLNNLYVRCMELNDLNSLYKIGIENLLNLPDDFDPNKFYSVAKKIDEYGAESTIKKLDKMLLCEFICKKLEPKHRTRCFKNFENIFNMAEAIISE